MIVLICAALGSPARLLADGWRLTNARRRT
jgi:hypothetical protein